MKAEEHISSNAVINGSRGDPLPLSLCGRFAVTTTEWKFEAVQNHTRHFGRWDWLVMHVFSGVGCSFFGGCCFDCVIIGHANLVQFVFVFLNV